MKPNLTDLFLCPVNPSESGSTGSGNLLTHVYKPECIYLATLPGDWNRSFEKGFTMYWDRLGSVVWIPTLSRELHTWYMLVSILTWRELSTETGYIRVHFFPDIITRVIRTYIYHHWARVGKHENKGVYMHTSLCACAYKSCTQAPESRPPAAARIQSKTTIFQQAGGSTTLLFRLLLPDFGRKRKTPPECRPHAAARFQRKNPILQQGVRKTRTAQVLNI